MTSIFSSKKELSEIKADNAQLKQSVADLTSKLESANSISNDIAGIKEQFGKEKAELNSIIETMKAEFSNEVNSLKQQLADMTKQKAEVEQTAQAEVEKAKETVKTQINEG